VKLLEGARGTLTVLRAVPGQRRATYAPQGQIAARRDARLRETVAYAAATVPHYQELFRRDGVDPRGIRTAEDLELLPLVDKPGLRADPRRFVSASPRARDAVAYRTIGTTGVPVEILHDRTSLLQNVAYAERERAVESHFVGKRVRYTWMSISDRTGTGNQTRAFYRRSMLAPVRPRRHSLSVSSPLEETIAAINLVQPDLIRSYGSFLELLYGTVIARGISMHKPKLVVYGGDRLTARGRTLIEEELGIPVVSRYNCVESFMVGFFCEERRWFHLHDDLCLVRIVDAEGRTVPDGTRGEVVISNLVNRGTVLLNYRLGDLAAIVTEPCGCGRTTRLLSELEGRAQEFVRLPDGSMVSPAMLGDVMEPYREVLRFQLVQVEPDRFDLRLVCADQQTFARVASSIGADASRLLAGAEVVPSYHDADGAPQVGKLTRISALPHGDATT
jgi:phenylacetate-CoA ligase